MSPRSLQLRLGTHPGTFRNYTPWSQPARDTSLCVVAHFCLGCFVSSCLFELLHSLRLPSSPLYMPGRENFLGLQNRSCCFLRLWQDADQHPSAVRINASVLCVPYYLTGASAILLDGCWTLRC